MVDESRPAAKGSEEQRRFPRSLERMEVVVKFDDQAVSGETLDVSKLGALVLAPEAPPVGELLTLEWVTEDGPDGVVWIQSRVARVVNRDEQEGVLFGVEFQEAKSPKPITLKKFLERVVGFEHGVVRVFKDAGGTKVFSFHFDPIHEEGRERLRALRNSLFANLEEMEEADRLLEDFGTGQSLFSGEDEKKTKKPAAASPEPPPAAPPKPPQAAPPEPAPQALAAAEDSMSEPEPAFDGELSSAEGMAFEELLEGEQPLDAAPQEQATEKKKKKKKEKKPKTKKVKRGFISSILSSLGSSGGDKGGELLDPKVGRATVANVTGFMVVVVEGSRKIEAMATRLYCAGMRCETDVELPGLYKPVSVRVPFAKKKKSEIVLFGDITRIRADSAPSPELSDEPPVGGIFEIRFSLRNSTDTLSDYRKLLDQLNAQN